jgi:hypothetical protein
MGDVQTWVYALGAPAWLALMVYVVRTARDWPNFMARWNERQRDKAEIEGDQIARMDARMLRLETRVRELEEAHEECLQHLQAERAGRAKEHAGRLEAEAMLMARQRGDQAVQLRISAEREIDAHDREDEKRKGGDK